MCCKSNHLTNTPHLLQQRHKISSFHNDEMYINGFPFYPSQGQMTEAIKYLEKVVKIARNNFQSLDVIRACTMLGDIYNEKVSCMSLFCGKACRVGNLFSLYACCLTSQCGKWLQLQDVAQTRARAELETPLSFSFGGGTPHQRPLPFSIQGD